MPGFGKFGLGLSQVRTPVHIIGRTWSSLAGTSKSSQTCSKPVNDRLSAVPFFEMVRTPNSSFVLGAEDNRSQRSSSVGNASRRLFSKSPVPEQERSSSENAASSLGQQTPSPQRGRQIPILPLGRNDQTWETSHQPPFNPYHRPGRAHPRASRGIG